MNNPEYQYCRDIIARLKQSSALSPSVLSEPFDAQDQVDQLTLAADQYDLAIAVKPEAINVPYQGADTPRPGLYDVTAAILIMTTTHTGNIKAGERIAESTAAVLAALQGWNPDGCELETNLPHVDSINTLLTDEVEGLNNLIGRAVFLTRRISIK